MKTSTKIWLIVGGIVVVLALQLKTGFLGNKKINVAIEEYYNTYGLTKEDWELLNSEGITIEDANAMEAYATSISQVGEMLEDILREIRAGKYNNDEDEDRSPEEIFLNNFFDFEGVWEANDIIRKGIEYAHLYVKIISKEDPLSFKVVLYDRQSEQIVREMDLEAFVINNKKFYLKSQNTNEFLTFTKYNGDYSMHFHFSDKSIYDTKNFYYDLTRITEEEFNNPTPYETDDFDYETDDFDYETDDFDYETDDFDYETDDFDYETDDFDYKTDDFDYETDDFDYEIDDSIYE